MLRDSRFGFGSLCGLVVVLACGSFAGAQTSEPKGVTAGSVALKTVVPSTIPIGTGSIAMGAGFHFNYEFKWDTAKGVLKAKGEIAWGVTILGKKADVKLLVSETDGKIVNGNTLEIAKTWKGKSGLRVNTLLHFQPEKDGRIAWSLKADGYNSNFPHLKHVKHNASGKIKTPKHPWAQP